MMTCHCLKVFLVVVTAAMMTSVASAEATSSRKLPGRHEDPAHEDNVDSPPQPPPGAAEPPQCEVSADGFYPPDMSRGGLDSDTIEFNYEIEYSLSEGRILQDMLFELEVAIANKILPTVFDSECDVRRKALRRRKLAVAGVSVNPPDRKLQGLDCSLAFNATENECAVIDGKMQLFSFFGLENGLVDSVLLEIETSMNAGQFNNADPDIVKVSYVTLTPDEIGGEDGANEDPEQETSASSGLGTGMYVVIAVGALFVVGAAVFWRRRVNKSDDADTPTLEPRGGSLVTEVDGAAAETTNGLDFSTIPLN